MTILACYLLSQIRPDTIEKGGIAQQYIKQK